MEDEEGMNEQEPKKVEALSNEVIVGVTCGREHTCAVTSTGSIYKFGKDGSAFVDLLPRRLLDLSSKVVICVSAGFFSTACVTKAGEVFTWGKGYCGKLGHGDESDQQTPKRVEALFGVKIIQVACGMNHTAVCSEDGHVYTFGRGEDGELGHGDLENRTSPVRVKALEDKHITQVQCGDVHTMALTSSGYVFTWGYNSSSQLGHYSTTKMFYSFPCLVDGLREHNVVQISCGSYYCIVMVDLSFSTHRQSQLAFFNYEEHHSDVVLMVENQPFYAKSEILCKKSDYFAAMFRCNMRESIERVVRVHECSRESFERVLEYLYFDGFRVSFHEVAEMWRLADMYQMEGLKLCCLAALERENKDAKQILKDIESLSCPCDELKRICNASVKGTYDARHKYVWDYRHINV